ncbi:MAG: hypothetical protein NVSMB17_05920 [Candidatus Dormibacteria bacterium]
MAADGSTGLTPAEGDAAGAGKAADGRAAGLAQAATRTSSKIAVPKLLVTRRSLSENGRMHAPAIATSGLTRDYGGGHGLFNLDLEVQEGEVFGYLGPNGAGKSTTIRLLMGMARPTRGSARVFGLDCTADSVAVKRLVGYLPGELPQFGGLRGSEVVAYLGNLRGGRPSGHSGRCSGGR